MCPLAGTLPRTSMVRSPSRVTECTASSRSSTPAANGSVCDTLSSSRTCTRRTNTCMLSMILVTSRITKPPPCCPLPLASMARCSLSARRYSASIRCSASCFAFSCRSRAISAVSCGYSRLGASTAWMSSTSTTVGRLPRLRHGTCSAAGACSRVSSPRLAKRGHAQIAQYYWTDLQPHGANVPSFDVQRKVEELERVGLQLLSERGRGERQSGARHGADRGAPSSAARPVH